MKVLGLETSGAVTGIAVADEQGLLAEQSFRHRMQLSQHLTPRIAETLSMAGVALEELDGIAVSVGPGSFTGLRIGVTAAKSLAFALNKPVIGVDTLAALASEYPAAPETLLCALVSASETEVYAGLFQWENGVLALRAEEQLMPVRLLTDRLSASPRSLVVLGDLGPHQPLLRERLGGRAAIVPADAAPRPATIARLGQERLRAGHSTPVHALAPRYLRPSAAEARRAAAGKQG